MGTCRAFYHFPPEARKEAVEISDRAKNQFQPTPGSRNTPSQRNLALRLEEDGM